MIKPKSRLRSVFALFIASVIGFNSVTTVFAAEVDPSLDTNAYRTRNNIIFYDPRDSLCGPASTSAPSTSSTTPSDVKYISAGNIPVNGKEFGASIYGGAYKNGGWVIQNGYQAKLSESQIEALEATVDSNTRDDPGIGNSNNPLHNTVSYAELSTSGGKFNAMGDLPNGTKLEITYQGKSVIAEKGDVGGGGGDVQGKTRAIDLWWETARLLDFKEGLGVVKVRAVDPSTPLTTVKSGATESAPTDSTPASCCAVSNAASTTATLQGSSNREKAFRYFIAKGLSAEQSAGIVGNLMVESGMTPDNQEDPPVQWPNGGWGIAQWTGSRRDDIKKAVEGAGLPYTNEKTPANLVEKLLAFELDFLWKEATKRGDIESLKSEAPAGGSSEKIIEKAVISWEKHYERAGRPALGARYDAAIKAFKELGGSNTADTTAPTGSNNSSCPQAASTGDFVYYSQYDPAWANSSYGSSTIQPSGCGPTSMAMIVATLKGDTSITPKTIATKYARFYIPGMGSSHGLFGAVAGDYGLKSENLGADEAKVRAALEAGALIVSGGSGPAPYTNSGHIIVIRAVTDNGKYLVGNPLPSPKNQGDSSATVVQNTEWFNTEYSWSQVAGNASGMYAITKK